MAAAVASSSRAAALAAAGTDLLVAYHSSVLRDAGLPSVAGLLPWVNANEATLSVVSDVVDGAGRTPVLATVCANDATRDLATVLDDLGQRRVCGVVNAPTSGLYEGAVRSELERHGLGYAAEVALIRAASEGGFSSLAYVFDIEQAKLMVAAGASALVVHLGFTETGGTAHPPDERCGIERFVRAARLVGEVAEIAAGSPVLVHGGPVSTPWALHALRRQLPERTGVGFFGASALAEAAAVDDIDAWRDGRPSCIDAGTTLSAPLSTFRRAAATVDGEEASESTSRKRRPGW